MRAQLSSKPAGPYTSVEDLLQLRFLAKDLGLSARKKSFALRDGAVRTRYKGRGMEFAEVRPYQAGDDVRTIDWRVTARVQTPYTKLFQEERERPVFVMVDQRSPMFFGSRTVFKSVYAAQLAATIAWTANQQSDRIGALIFGDQEQRDIRAKTSKHSVLDLINQLVEMNRKLISPVNPSTSIDTHALLTEVSRIARPGSMVALISDFHGFNANCAEPLAQLGKTSDVFLFHTFDPLERQLPPVSQLMISNGVRRANINPAQINQAFSQTFDEQKSTLRQACLNAGIQYVAADVSQNLAEYVRDIFGKRNRKAGAAKMGVRR